MDAPDVMNAVDAVDEEQARIDVYTERMIGSSVVMCVFAVVVCSIAAVAWFDGGGLEPSPNRILGDFLFLEFWFMPAQFSMGAVVALGGMGKVLSITCITCGVITFAAFMLVCWFRG